MRDNDELCRIAEADQADRRDHHAMTLWQWWAVRARDKARKTRVRALLSEGAARTAMDYRRASLIFHHGRDVDDYRQAYELALRAVELGDWSARNPAATAYDRWLVARGEPQKFGTQFGRDGKPLPVDPTTTDAERAEWLVPPLQRSFEAYRGVLLEFIQRCEHRG